MNRSEIIFLYDVNNTNPNGDPADENKPRIDEDSGINIVTDVRLKRTIRDHLMNFKGEELFVREIHEEDGGIQDAKTRAIDFLTDDKKKEVKSITLKEGKEIVEKAVKNKCIDIRLFGATIPLEFNAKAKGSIQITGPSQFKMGRSLHRVEMMHIKGTGAFASEKGKGQKTFREEYFLPYSLIMFYGLINEQSAKNSGMTDEDVDKLMDGIWNGTKNLITRSKVGQVPRLLLRVEYKEGLFHIGDLDNYICPKLADDKLREEQIRDVEQIPLELSGLRDKLKEYKDRIAKIYYQVDERLVTMENGECKSLPEILKGTAELVEMKL